MDEEMKTEGITPDAAEEDMMEEEMTEEEAAEEDDEEEMSMDDITEDNHVYLHSLIDLLKEKGIITEEELNKKIDEYLADDDEEDDEEDDKEGEEKPAPMNQPEMNQQM